MKAHTYTIAIFTAALLLAAFNQASAQGAGVFKKRYDTGFISRFGNSFRKAGQRLNFSDLKSEFPVNAVSHDLYHAASQNRTISKIAFLGSLASVLTGFVFASSRNKNGLYVCLGTQMVLTIGANQFRRKYVEQIDLALAERNRTMLFQ